VDSSGNLTTLDTTNSPFTCDTINTKTVDCSDTLTAQIAHLGATTIGSVSAATNPDEHIIFGNSTGTITIASSNIINPPAGNNSLLMLNPSGNIITGDTSNYPITCGRLNINNLNCTDTITAKTANLTNLTASQSTLGTLKTANISCSGNTIINGNFIAGTAAYSQITLGCKTGLITIIGAFIKNAEKDDNNLLMVNQYGNVWTGNTARKTPLTFGTLTCDNFTAAAGAGQNINLGNPTGTITINGANIIKPMTGINPLYINQYGAIRTVTSSRTYKQNINVLKTNNSFDLLEPVSFYYIEDDAKKIQYGFIAEQLVEIHCLKDTVIYNEQGNPDSINYQAVFVALTADYLTTKKALISELKQKDHILNKLNNDCKSLQSELTQKNEELNTLKHRCNLLEIAIKQITSKLA
jgi:hypothetical protein